MVRSILIWFLVSCFKCRRHLLSLPPPNPHISSYHLCHISFLIPFHAITFVSLVHYAFCFFLFSPVMSFVFFLSFCSVYIPFIYGIWYCACYTNTNSIRVNNADILFLLLFVGRYNSSDIVQQQQQQPIGNFQISI